jgi:single-strand DNA-binding protein
MNDGLNRVILLGNLGADPELRYTQTGTPVLSLRLATNESYQDRNKETQERTEWHSVVVWGTRAEGLSKVLCKGTRLLVEGALRTSSYEKDGVKRYKTEIHAKEVSVTAGRRESALGLLPEEEAVMRAAAAARNGAAHPPAKQEVVEEMPY